MKLLFVLLLTVSSTLYAQDVLQFNKRFVESEDKWVAFQKGKDSSYMFGYIYIDGQAGLTLNHEGSFTITDAGVLIPKKIENAGFKSRLKPNNVLVAFIPESKFAELKIDAVPDWLKYYRKDTASVERLYRWGFIYNGYNECAKGLGYLERAQKLNPKFKGLAVELAFSYNCLAQYDKAIEVLQDALKENPADAYINKELVYALVKSGQMDKAAQSCKNALAACTDKQYNFEMCYNVLHTYYLNKDKAGFNAWLAETKKWVGENESLKQSIAGMEGEMGK